MNEQLIVKNFGPIKDATVDFKRVTVFIGPTGGGKSTLAKLAAVFNNSLFLSYSPQKRLEVLADYAITLFLQETSAFEWRSSDQIIVTDSSLDFKIDFDKTRNIGPISDKIVNQELSDSKKRKTFFELIDYVTERADKKSSDVSSELLEKFSSESLSLTANFLKKLLSTLDDNSAKYIPSERVFVSAASYSWPGFIRDNIGLPKQLVKFANDFSVAQKEIIELDLSFLQVRYLHRDGKDFIEIPGAKTLFPLYETASGIQSVTPLLVLLEHMSRNTEQAQSFIIEEPELNLFPLAQFELVKILVEKCAQLDGKNDLVLTTHSPYILTALNLLCYAYRIAQQDEATAKRVAKLIPRHCWIDPDQFAAYYVDRPDTKRKQQVRSIINKKTGLIEENELDTTSDELGSLFDKLVKLRKPTATPARTKE